MRISDWSSDVCSSDLNIARDFHGGRFPRVTFERAICDWIYFTRRWRMLCPEPGDIDLDGVSVPRMRRIADAMGIRRRFECWYERWLVVQADEECVGQYSKQIGRA